MELVQKHWLALCASVIVGFLVSGPNLFFTHSTLYEGLPLIYTDAETYYLARINAALHNCVLNCNPFIREYASEYPFFEPSLVPQILTSPAYIFEVSALDLKRVYDFVLPAVLTLLIYSFIFRLTTSTYWSLLGSLYILLGFNLINSEVLFDLSEIFDIARFKLTEHTRFLLYARPLHPQFSALVLISYFHLLLSCFRSTQAGWYMLLGLVYGCSFYVYFYDYTFLTVLAGVSILLCVWLEEYGRALKLMLATLFGLALGIPLILNLAHLLQHPLFASLRGTDESIVYSHMPHISLIGILLFLVCAIAAYIFSQKTPLIPKEAYVVFMLVAASFIILNQHIISGHILENFHYEWYIITPILVITLAAALHSLVAYEGIVKYRVVFALLLLLPIVNGASIQYASYLAWLPRAIEDQSYVPALSWLKNEPSSIVAATPEFSALVSITTPHKVLWAPYAFHYLHEPAREALAMRVFTSCDALIQAHEEYRVTLAVFPRDAVLSCEFLSAAYVDAAVAIYRIER